jgi:peptidase M24-like protein
MYRSDIDIDLGRYMSNKINALSNLEQLAQQCTRAISASLQPGMSEQDAASLMREWLKQQGVTEHLHRPLAWFGPRTALSGRSGWLQRPGIRPEYFPSNTRLREGMAVALYCAPHHQGVAAESLFCTTSGINPNYHSLLADTDALRDRLASAIGAGQSIESLEGLMLRFAARHQLRLRHQRQPLVDWLRPYSISPDLGYADKRIVDKLVGLTGNPLPAHLPTSQIPICRHSPLAAGLWVIQPWLVREQRGAGFRALLNISQQDDGLRTQWLNEPLPRTSSASMLSQQSA